MLPLPLRQALVVKYAIVRRRAIVGQRRWWQCGC